MSDKRAKRGKVWEPVGQACLVLHVGGTVATIGLFSGEQRSRVVPEFGAQGEHSKSAGHAWHCAAS